MRHSVKHLTEIKIFSHSSSVSSSGNATKMEMRRVWHEA